MRNRCGARSQRAVSPLMGTHLLPARMRRSQECERGTQECVRHVFQRRGSALVEAALLVPILLALLIGTEELARVTYNYYMIQKVLTGLALYLGTQQGVNYCNAAGDPIIQAAINNALTGTVDGSGDPIVNGLTPSMVQVTASIVNSATQQLSPCDCQPDCDSSQGGVPPGFIVVSLVNGYTVQPLFWGFTIDPFPLVPSVTAPYAGT
jgi:hypothetical protein